VSKEEDGWENGLDGEIDWEDLLLELGELSAGESFIGYYSANK